MSYYILMKETTAEGGQRIVDVQPVAVKVVRESLYEVIDDLEADFIGREFERVARQSKGSLSVQVAEGAMIRHYYIESVVA